MERLTAEQIVFVDACREAFHSGASRVLGNRFVAGHIDLAGGATEIVLRQKHDRTRTLCLATFDESGNVIRFVDCRRYRIFENIREDGAYCPLGGVA